jgi:C-terminal processing protease CtpA/Prc
MKHRTPNIEPGTSKRELRKIRIKFLAACLVTFATAFTSLEVLSKPGDESNAAPNVVFDAVCKALQENYPMLEYAGWKNEWMDEFKTRINEATNVQEGFLLIDELVCRLDDYHTKFFWAGKPQGKSPPFRVEPVFKASASASECAKWDVRPTLKMPGLQDVVIAVVVAQTNIDAKIGDEILEVNEVPVGEALGQAWLHVSCSSMFGKLRGAAWRVFQMQPDAELKLKIRRHGLGDKEEVMMITTPRTGDLRQEIVSAREEDGIPVIRISAWANSPAEELVPKFDSVLKRFRQRPGMIIDVRGNGGGQDDLAAKVVGRFVGKPVIASISFHRLVPGVTFERSVEEISPRGPWRYEGRVAVLTDEGCMSATEHFVSGMCEAGALLCGTPTSGACGWIRPINLPGGARLNSSQTFPLHTGGMPSPLMGIAPHIYAHRTLAELQAAKDTALLVAVRWVKSSDPIPERQQPLSSFAR